MPAASREDPAACTGDAPARGFPLLDIARFFAALGVACFHFVAPTLPPGAIRNVLASGFWCVSFFFMLSGFVLAYVYARRSLTAPEQRRDYAVRRFARIYPVYALAWLLTGVCVILEAFGQTNPWAHIARRFSVYGTSALLLIQSWIPGLSQKWNWPGWSLSVEMFCYALFPALLMPLARLDTRHLIRWLMMTLALFIGLTAFALALNERPLLQGTILETNWYYYLGEHPLTNLPLFVIGIILARLHLSGVRVPHPGRWLAIALLAHAATLAAGPDGHLGALHWDLLLPPQYAAILFLLAQWHGSIHGIWNRLGVLLGKASYPLYMLQIPCWVLFRTLLPHAPTTSVLSACAFVAGLIALSVAVHLLFEAPMEGALKRALGARIAGQAVQGRLHLRPTGPA